MGAPVCNINPASPPPSSRAPALPSIPLATDLTSAIAAVNALRQLVIQYFNQTGGGSQTAGPRGAVGVPGTAGTPGVPGGSKGDATVGNFEEVPTGRITTTTRIYDLNDPTQQTYIDVEQITGLQFANKTGQTIVWNQNP